MGFTFQMKEKINEKINSYIKQFKHYDEEKIKLETKMFICKQEKLLSLGDF